MMGLILSIITIAFFLQTNIVKADESEPDKYVQSRLIVSKTNVSGGEEIRVGIEKIIYPNWHTYWKNPGDSGTPLNIEWTLPEGFTTTEIEWPTPKKIPYGPLTNYGYEEQVTLLQNIKVPNTIPDGPIMLEAQISMLVCKDICIPESHQTWITLNGSTSADPEKIKVADNALPTMSENRTEFYTDEKNLILLISKDEIVEGAENITLYPEEWGLVNNNKQAYVKETDTHLIITQERGERDLSEVDIFNFVISFETETSKNHSLKFKAHKNLYINNTTNGYEAFSLTALIQAIIFALIGGLILNLMPCVFPVLSMKALSLANLHGKEKEKAKGYGLSYTAGILLSFAAIGGALLILKAGGSQIGWGFQLQNPMVITFLTYLIFLIGLNLLGMFELTGGFTNVGQKLTQKNDNRGAFFTGVLATLVATPCTAPFMGVAMGYTLPQPAPIAITVFLALGLGLALPYLSLCYIPVLRAKLPRPGAWMETFKQLLSFPMFMTAAWLVWVLTEQVDTTALILSLTGLVLLTFVIWLKRLPKSQTLAGKLRVLSISVALAYIIISPILIACLQNTGEKNLDDFSQEKIEQLLSGDDPVFTNMTAAWCITCKVNERTSLNISSTREIFAENNIQYLKGDWTNQNPEITKYLNKFNRQGVPLYVFYGARDLETGERPQPVVLPQLLSPGAVKDAITGK